MALCTDDATTYLKRLGYNVVRHPREGIQPLDLIGVQRSEVRYLGRIDQLITAPPAALPKISRDNAAADVNGQASSKLKAAIGVNVLGAFLGALGGGNANVAAGYKGAKTIQFVFESVLLDQAKPLDIGNYLRDGDVDAANLILQQYVLGNGRLFVISQTVKTNKFSVKAETASDVEASLDVPVIKQLLGGNVSVTAASERSGTITYAGQKQLVFGFQCFEIGVVGGELSLTSAKAGGIALSAGAESKVSPTVIDDQGLLDMVD